jgi:DegV family protein with EDD domain
MAKVAIVTDSSTCLPDELLAAHRIHVAPLAILFGGDVYEDGALSGPEFYSLLRSCRDLPTTAAPAPAAYLEAFKEASRDSDSALCVTLSSTYSGSYSSALTALDLARRELPDFPVRVLDSHSLAMCYGFAVLAAARAADEGADLDATEAVVREVASRAYLIGAIDTLRYLAKSGRVPKVMHWATSLLRIKPIFEAVGEDVHTVARSRTMPGATRRMLAEIERRLGGQRPLHLAVMHADAPEAAAALAEAARARLHPEELLVTEFTSVMGVHAGPGFLGLAYFTGSGEPAPPTPVATAATASEEDVAKLEATIAAVPASRSRPALVLVSGLPGSGKSHFSRALAARHPLAHLDIDTLRRTLFERPAHDPPEHARLFAAVHALIQRLLSRGVSVLLDATSLKEAHRRPLYEIAKAAGATLVIVRTEAPEDVALQRLEDRARGADPLDASEASAAVYNKMKAETEPIDRPHIVVDTSKEIEPALEEVLRQLESASESLSR